MNWLRGLRGGSAAPAAAESDWVRLRQAIAAAPTAEDRIERERELGRACAAHAQAPALDDPPGVWVEAVCHAADKAEAAQWGERVQDEDALAEIAVNGRYAEVRLAAARRVSDLQTLKRVAAASRDKDKQVYRHCSNALSAHRQGGERARRAAQIALSLRALLAARPVAVSRLLQLEKELAALGEGADQLAGCAALLAQAQACIIEDTQAQIALRARLAAAATLRAEIADAAMPQDGNVDAWRDRLAAIKAESAGAPAWLEKFPAGRELAQVLQEVELRLAARIQEAQLAALAAERAAMEAERAALQALEAPPPAERPAAKPSRPAKPEVDRAALQTLLGEIEQHLEEGRLADADALAGRIAQVIGRGTIRGPIAQRWQSVQEHLARLRGWARWGTDQAREQLIADAEALLAREPSLEDRARLVPAMHKEWQRLDAHGAAAKALWARFDAALTKAYRPVLEHRAAQAARHESARAAKAAWCDAWEAWFQQASADSVDFKAVEAKRDEIAGQWRNAAMAAFRDERRLRRRLDVLLKRIDALLQGARNQEVARREQLLAEAEALRDVPELGRAISEARALQARWKDEAAPLRLRHGLENQLWQRFRAACNAVFERRDAQRAGQAAEREQRMQARESERSAAQQAEARRKAEHAARFERMAATAATAEPLTPGQLAQGHAARAALLIDLEIALELPTPEAQSVERRARALGRLQERFRATGAAPAEPEAMVKQWHATAAAPDADQSARMAAIVRRLLERS